MTKRELRVVIDTNVVMSAAMFEDSIPFQVLFAAAREGRILLSLETEEELKEVILRRKFDKYVPEDERLDSWSGCSKTRNSFVCLSNFTYAAIRRMTSFWSWRSAEMRATSSPETRTCWR